MSKMAKAMSKNYKINQKNTIVSIMPKAGEI